MDEYQMEFSTGFGESYQNCPACGKEMVTGHNECFRCGVVVDRFQDRIAQKSTKETIGGIDHLSSLDIKTLDKKWKQVVVNYNDQNTHQEFIGQCQKNGALPFAVYHYSKMLEIDREDDIAQLMRRQALSRLTVSMVKAGDNESTHSIHRSVDIFIKWVNWVGLVSSTSCVMAGLLIPGARNLVGLGVAALTLFVALFLYRRS